jgi:lysine N6-hydroxylase
LSVGQDEGDLVIDAVGIGIGPFNLSVAALLYPISGLRTRYFERRPQFQWHPGILFPESTIQVSFLKDLVTLADPTNPFSFLAFLSAQKRLYRFINARFGLVTRQEFNQYFRWVCSQLPNLEFNQPVDAISYDKDTLVVELRNEKVRTKNIILGTGLLPYIPDCAKPHLGSTVFHASTYLQHNIQPRGQRIAVVGGGQTGAEIVFHLLADSASLPEEVIWISRRPNFLPLDDSPFTNELFMPGYSNYFFNLSEQYKRQLLMEQKLASDGISTELLEKLYRRLYELEFLEQLGRPCSLSPSSELVGMNAASSGWTIDVQDTLTGQISALDVDIVVLCTGFAHTFPSYLQPLMQRIHWDKNGFLVNDDFSILWDGHPSLKIYVLNAAKHARGVADPNLSLMAWRSAMIVNSLVGRRVYDVEEASSAFNWMRAGTTATPYDSLKEG